MTAEEGRKLGFVNEVAPVSKALDVALAWAEQILEQAPVAVRAAKEAVHTSLDKPTLEEAIRTVYPIHSTLSDTEDFIEGPKAFAEKRKPVWKNR